MTPRSLRNFAIKSTVIQTYFSGYYLAYHTFIRKLTFPLYLPEMRGKIELARLWRTSINENQIVLHKRNVSFFLDISQYRIISPNNVLSTLSTCKDESAKEENLRLAWQDMLRIHYFLKQRKRATTINQYLESITDVSRIQRQSSLSLFT